MHRKKDVLMEDVAARAGVTVMTVSRVINNSPFVKESTREKILSIIKTMGYRPNPIAKALVQRNRYSKVIGLCVSVYRHLFTVDYFLRVLRGVTETVGEMGYDLMMFNTNKKDSKIGAEYLNFTRLGAVDGMIVVAPRIDEPAISEIEAMNIPLVLISAARNNGTSYIDSDNVKGANMAVRHLIKNGHKRIATITGDLNVTNGIDRLKGYRQALEENGLTYDERYVENGRFEMDEAYEGMKRLLKLSARPTAVFCANDFMAVTATKAIKEAGLSVPRDIALVGYDDSNFCLEKEPQLSSVRQPCEEMGKLAVEKIDGIVRNKIKKQVKIILPVELKVRGSSDFRK